MTLTAVPPEEGAASEFDDAQEILRLCALPRADIGDVVELLTQLQPLVERVNPFAAHFNFLYLQVTTRVEEFEQQERYENAEFLRTLDVRFADRYVEALTGWISGDPGVPGAWMLVFEPDDEDLEPTQYAALGVNAHINVDLAMALVATFDDVGCEPMDGSAEHHDYLLVNQIFYEVIPGLRRVFLGFEPQASLLDSLENWILQIVIDETRDQAWDEACRFWPKRQRDGYLERKEQKLDFIACLLGEVVESTPVQVFLAVTDPPEPPSR